jgi:hypothetical protein
VTVSRTEESSDCPRTCVDQLDEVQQGCDSAMPDPESVCHGFVVTNAPRLTSSVLVHHNGPMPGNKPSCRRRASSSPKNQASAIRPFSTLHMPASMTSTGRPVAGIPYQSPV